MTLTSLVVTNNEPSTPLSFSRRTLLSRGERTVRISFQSKVNRFNSSLSNSSLLQGLDASGKPFAGLELDPIESIGARRADYPRRKSVRRSEPKRGRIGRLVCGSQRSSGCGRFALDAFAH